MTRRQPLSAAILAGGRSRRMGQDKALLRLGDRTMLEVVAARAAGVADEVFFVASGRPEYERLGFRVVPDRLAEAGSLGGIFTALLTARNPYCLVLACDMPFVNPDLLAYMAGLPRDYDVLVPALPAEKSDQGGDATLETLHAIYGKGCLAPIESRLQAGRYKIVGFFEDVRVRRIEGDELRRLDPELRSTVNANTPEEFAAAAARAGDRDSPPGRTR